MFSPLEKPQLMSRVKLHYGVKNVLWKWKLGCCSFICCLETFIRWPSPSEILPSLFKGIKRNFIWIFIALKTFLKVWWRNFCFLWNYMTYYVFPPLEVFFVFDVSHLCHSAPEKPVGFFFFAAFVMRKNIRPISKLSLGESLDSIKIDGAFSKY